jgi:hypothetical protein
VSQIRLRTARLVAAAALALGASLPGTVPAAAAEPLELEARVMLQGHARVGAWMAIDVRIRNDGPPVVGELRLAGGAQGRTRFATPVDLPTTSDKHYRLYAQPPAFGGSIDVELVSGSRTVAKQAVAFSAHSTTQLVVGLVAERPQGLVGSIDLLPDQAGAQPAIVALAPEDLPDRVEAWAPLDRLVWQDMDSTRLTAEQVAALRGWLVAGGRLVIVGGTANVSSLSAFPDDILPFRPEATIDVAPQALGGLLGQLPAAATDLPALSGSLARGRALASVGDRAVAAEAVYGSGVVAIVGFDPTVEWVADSVSAGTGLWRRLLPPRANTVVVTSEDGQIVNAVSQLPALALPPIGGLLALLAGYIVLIGPANYLVLRRLDRREWAWITMPILIAVFAVGSYGFGAALRGLDVIVNEVAIVRGAPDATEGTAQVYLGVFSPSRGTYQVEVGNGALLAPTLTGDFVSGGETASLDIVQGDPARVRDLVVGFGSLRTLRAEAATTVPRIQADLRLDGGTLRGEVRNLSDETLERPAIVLGSSVIVIDDLAPGETSTVSLPIRANPFGQSLSDRILGTLFFGDPSRSDDSNQRNTVRHYVIDQLTYDPNWGTTGQLPSETPVLLAWGSRQVLDVRIENQVPRRTGNVLYYIPLAMDVSGRTAFEADLVRSSVVEVDALFFSKDPFSIGIGTGSITMAYRPIAFDGTLAPTRLLMSLGWGGEVGLSGGTAVPIEPMVPGIEPVPVPAPSCDPKVQDCGVAFDGLPGVEVFDRTGDGVWVQLPRLAQGTVYELRNPARYVDSATGAVLVRFTADRPEGANFSFQVRIEGDVQ